MNSYPIMRIVGHNRLLRLARPVVALCALLLGSASVFADGLALVGGTVIDGTGGTPQSEFTILVENGRISAMGPERSTPVPEDFERIDVTGKWLTPGMIDSNVHLILLTVPEFFVKYEDRLVEVAIQSAQVGLKYGLTTMPDTWGPLAPLLEARDRINDGEFVGSRVLVAGNIVGTGGPFTASFMGGWDPRGYSLRYGGWVHPDIQHRINRLWEDDVGPAMAAMTPDEAADALRNYIAKGVDFVKIGVSGHGLGAVEPLVFSREALMAMTRVVREAGIPLTTHTFTVESLRLAVEMEPDLLLHPNVMSPSWNSATQAQKDSIRKQMDIIREKNLFAGLMAIPEKEKLRVYAEWDAVENASDASLNRVMLERTPFMGGQEYEQAAAGLKAWLESGVQYTIATDQGPDSADVGPVVWGRLGRMHFSRMVGLQDAGAQPMDILVAATRNGARAYGLGDDLGTVEVGKIADLLILDRDPLEDIANMKSISVVIKDGIVIDRESLPTVKVLDYDPEATWPN